MKDRPLPARGKNRGDRSGPAGGSRVRLDRELVRRGYFDSRKTAWAHILSGRVLVEGEVVSQAFRLITASTDIAIKEPGPYVSRGGIKLDGALKHFGVSPEGLVCLDAGSGTGGFSDCLLKNGARRVYCVDVGYGILHHSLRKDRRVILLERRNVRYLKPADIGEEVDLAVIDLSFISLKRVLPVVASLLKDGGLAIPLVKPQFEARRGDVEKGGVLRDEHRRLEVVEGVKDFSARCGFDVKGDVASTLPGHSGNVEHFLLLMRKGENKGG